MWAELVSQQLNPHRDVGTTTRMQPDKASRKLQLPLARSLVLLKPSIARQRRQCGADQLQNKLIVGNDRRGGAGELKLDWIVYRPEALAGK